MDTQYLFTKKSYKGSSDFFEMFFCDLSDLCIGDDLSFLDYRYLHRMYTFLLKNDYVSFVSMSYESKRHRVLYCLSKIKGGVIKNVSQKRSKDKTCLR